MVSNGVGGVGLALGSSLLELCECSVSGLGLAGGWGGGWWWPPVVPRPGMVGMGLGWGGCVVGPGLGLGPQGGLCSSE